MRESMERNDPGCPRLSNQNVTPPTAMRPNPIRHHKRLYHRKNEHFQRKQFKVWKCINTDCVCLTAL